MNLSGDGDKLISVGIDLTGAEQRPSGWALLRGNQAAFQELGTDRDIVEATLNTRARVISIDSPLGLPKGRC